MTRGKKPKSAIVKRSIVILGHKTSVSLEDQFWIALKLLAQTRRQTLSEFVAAIDLEREAGNLSSQIRLAILQHYQEKAA
jgi:predicted DNA-binding ribbon-helix-helix protein